MLSLWRGVSACLALLLVVLLSLEPTTAAEFSPDHFGIGAKLGQDSSGAAIRVLACVDGGPAKRAGMKPGDILKSVDGQSLAGWSFHQTLDYLLQLEPLPLVVTVLRDSEERSFELLRARFSDIMAGVGLKYVKDSLGYQAVPLEELVPLRAGDPLGTYELVDTAGQSSHWAHPSSGPCLVYFWAEWCSPCKSLMKRMRGQMSELQDRGVAVVGVSLDRDCETFQRAVETLSPPGDQLWGQGWYGNLSQRLRIHRKGIPSAAHIDTDGNLVRVAAGADSIVAMIQSMTGE